MRIRGRIHRRPGRAAIVAGLAAVFVLAPTVPAMAGESPADEIPPMLRAPGSEPATPAAPAAGLRIYIDPVTGEITSRPAPEQVRDLSHRIEAFRFEQSIEEGVEPGVGNLTRFDLRGGGTGVYVGGRFLTSTMVQVAPDGSLRITCTPHPEEILDADPNHPGRPLPPVEAPLK